jgi:hypothetical protein
VLTVLTCQTFHRENFTGQAPLSVLWSPRHRPEAPGVAVAVQKEEPVYIDILLAVHLRCQGPGRFRKKKDASLLGFFPPERRRV